MGRGTILNLKRVRVWTGFIQLWMCHASTFKHAVPWRRWMVAGLPLKRPGFVVGKVTLGASCRKLLNKSYILPPVSKFLLSSSFIVDNNETFHIN
jgi:hypothetical protein